MVVKNKPINPGDKPAGAVACVSKNGEDVDSNIHYGINDEDAYST